MKQVNRHLPLLLGAILSLACINTTYSRFDEIEITNDLVHLVLGQFAHHGPAFYKAELARTSKFLENAPDDFDARNDRGAALLKLGRYDEAEKEFRANEETYPDRYKTHSNLGVLYKKAGRYEEAAASIDKALIIKPGGHMGLGDYYLQMIHWLGKVDADNETSDKPVPYGQRVAVPPKENFLGISYNSTPEEVAEDPRVNREYLITLVKNDYKFADVYLVLGDVLLIEGDHQVALRCYLRADNLEHPAETVVQGRIYWAEKHIKSALPKVHIMEPKRRYASQFKMEALAAEGWLADFQSVEAQRLAAGQPVDFKSMKEAMRLAGKSRPKVIELAAYKGEIGERGDGLKMVFKGLLGFAIFGVIIIYVRQPKKQAE